jgi:hypothetical protein
MLMIGHPTVGQVFPTISAKGILRTDSKQEEVSFLDRSKWQEPGRTFPRKVKGPLTPKDKRPQNTKHKQTVTDKVTA